MKYFIIALLAVGLVACGEEAKSEDKEDTPTTQEDEQPEADDTSNADTEEADDEEAEEGADTEETPQNFSGPAKIKFDSKMHDFGLHTVGDSVATFYTFQNVGGEDLTIKSIKPSCSCTGIQYTKKTYKSGEKGKIRVSYPTKGKLGLNRKTVQVFTNVARAPEVLKFSLEVKE